MRSAGGVFSPWFVRTRCSDQRLAMAGRVGVGAGAGAGAVVIVGYRRRVPGGSGAHGSFRRGNLTRCSRKPAINENLARSASPLTRAHRRPLEALLHTCLWPSLQWPVDSDGGGCSVESSQGAARRAIETRRDETRRRGGRGPITRSWEASVDREPSKSAAVVVGYVGRGRNGGRRTG